MWLNAWLHRRGSERWGRAKWRMRGRRDGGKRANLLNYILVWKLITYRSAGRPHYWGLVCKRCWFSNEQPKASCLHRHTHVQCMSAVMWHVFSDMLVWTGFETGEKRNNTSQRSERETEEKREGLDGRRSRTEKRRRRSVWDTSVTNVDEITRRPPATAQLGDQLIRHTGFY